MIDGFLIEGTDSVFSPHLPSSAVVDGVARFFSSWESGHDERAVARVAWEEDRVSGIGERRVF